MKTLVYSRLKAKNHEKNCYEALVAALAHTASPCVCVCAWAIIRARACLVRLPRLAFRQGTAKFRRI